MSWRWSPLMVVALALCVTGVAAAQNKLVIVSIGDSSASGEGNPPWEASTPEGRLHNHDRLSELLTTDTGCHRSKTAAPRLVARQLQDLHPELEVEFTSFACSGAKVRHLIDTEETLPFPNPKMGIQLDMLESFYEGRRIDALIINIGINDVGFSEMFQKCATNFVPWGQPDRCYERDYALCPDGEFCPTERAAQLGAAYDMLMRRISALNVEVGNVYLTEYPAAVKDDQARFCHHEPDGDFLGGISRDESRWAQGEAIMLLNAEGAHLADAGRPTPPGYHHVVGVVRAFNSHGFCASDRFVRTMKDALDLGNPHGILHPNRLGHEAWADVFQPYVDQVVPPAVPHVATFVDASSLRALWAGVPRAASYQVAWRRAGAEEAMVAPIDPADVIGNPPHLSPGPGWTLVPQTALEWSLSGSNTVADVAVRACTTDACSRWSAVRRLSNQLPNPPIQLRGTSTQLGFDLSWAIDPQRNGVTEYVVASRVAGTSRRGLVYQRVQEPRAHLGLGSHDVFVRACFNPVLCGPWSNGLRVSSDKPTTPTRLRKGNQIGQAVVINWEDRSRTETHFEVAFLRHGGEPFVYEREIRVAESWYHLFTATPAWVWVRACGDVKCSAWSSGLRFFGPLDVAPPPDEPIAPRPFDQPGPTPPPPL